LLTQVPDLILVSRFWEGSWEDGAQTWSAEKGAYDPSKIHKITYNGQHHKASAFSQSHPSPQRTPVIFQAGASKAGKGFAARHAEAIFLGGGDPVVLGKTIKEMRDLAAQEGRDPSDLKFFPMLTPVLGRTLEEAQAKYDAAEKLVDWEAGLAMLSDFSGIDLSQFPPDEPMRFGDGAGDNLQSMVNVMKSLVKEGMTLKQLGHDFAFLGFGCVPIGTPEMVADVIEKFVEVSDVDGFNLGCKLIYLSPSPPLQSTSSNNSYSRLKSWIIRGHRRAVNTCSPEAWYHVDGLCCTGRDIPRKLIQRTW
jgi:alkanesulfonate monooxygenase SsuD/methylene tetrahydromethanopterin reductase-like flavin-dependent oxidoreductase (luciferase family)